MTTDRDVKARTLWTLITTALLFAGCSANGSSEDELPISAETYYSTMQVGNFAAYDRDSLDEIGSALCEDMEDLSNDERRAVVLALEQQTDNELEAFTSALAITGRHCPEHFHLWDDEVEKIMDGELPWGRG